MNVSSAPAPVGYYGKIPIKADFISRRLAYGTIETWDPWLQGAVAESRRRLGGAWQDRFFVAPIWRFILPAGTCGEAGLMGVLMPSVDSVGRCFPLTLAVEIEARIDPLSLLAGSANWFTSAEDLALSALGDGFVLDDLEQVLPAWKARHGPPATGDRRAAPDHPAAGAIGSWCALPLASAGAAKSAILSAGWPRDRPAWPSIWWTAGTQNAPAGQPAGTSSGLSPGLAITRGLVPPAGFAALLDGCWSEHGWTVLAETGELDVLPVSYGAEAFEGPA